MVFQKLFGGERKPFLELSDDGGNRPLTTVAPAPKPVAVAAPAAPSPKAPAPAEPAGQPSITTAEALAAERAAAQKAETPRELTTFAAELLNPAQALPRGRRRPGASLAPFRDLASSLRGSR